MGNGISVTISSLSQDHNILLYFDSLSSEATKEFVILHPIFTAVSQYDQEMVLYHPSEAVRYCFGVAIAVPWAVRDALAVVVDARLHQGLKVSEEDRVTHQVV